MIQIRNLIDDLGFMHSVTRKHRSYLRDPRLKQSYDLIKAMLENFWIEGEPGHEEYHIHPKAFGDEEDVRL